MGYGAVQNKFEIRLAHVGVATRGAGKIGFSFAFTDNLTLSVRGIITV